MHAWKWEPGAGSIHPQRNKKSPGRGLTGAGGTSNGVGNAYSYEATPNPAKAGRLGQAAWNAVARSEECLSRRRIQQTILIVLLSRRQRCWIAASPRLEVLTRAGVGAIARVTRGSGGRALESPLTCHCSSCEGDSAKRDRQNQSLSYGAHSSLRFFYYGEILRLHGGWNLERSRPKAAQTRANQRRVVK